MATLIHHVRWLHPGRGLFHGSLLIEGTRIACIDPGAKQLAAVPNLVQVDGQGQLLTPGLIDVHTHGIGPHLYERSPEDLVQGTAFVASHGVTCLLPTLYRLREAGILNHLARLAQALEQVSTVCCPGFHLEGPFLALPGAGADTLPGDIKRLKDLYAACGGKVAAMSVSPDTPGIVPVIEWLAGHKVVPFLTHTRASVEETQKAIAAGARHATHFYDVFPLPAEADPGVRPAGAVETILAFPGVSVDFIADGVHVHPMAIRAALAAKGPRKVVLITDSAIGAGLPEGTYDTPWGFPVHVKPGDGARIADPKHPSFRGLAGSALTMEVGMQNLLQWLDLPAHHTWALGTANPARLLGLQRKGTIRVGADADLVLWDDKLHAQKTWVGGRLVYEAPGIIPGIVPGSATRPSPGSRHGSRSHSPAVQQEPIHGRV